MKKAGSFICCFFFSLCLMHAQNLTVKLSDTQQQGLKGPVKEQKDLTYKAVKKGKRIVTGEKCGDAGGSYYAWKYNAEGNCTEEFWYNLDGSIYSRFVNEYTTNSNRTVHTWYNADNSVRRKEVFTYNEKGQKTEMITYNADGSQAEIWNYVYDDKANLVEMTWNYKDVDRVEKSMYKYDERGNMTELYIRYSTGGDDYKQTYVYDEKGNKVKEQNYNVDGNLDGSFVAYTYDGSGNITQEQWFRSANTLDYRTTYAYDDKNNETERVDYNGDGTITGRISSQYTYDQQENWTKKIQFKNGEPTTVTTREISYYK
jgi:hypothetical protein